MSLFAFGCGGGTNEIEFVGKDHVYTFATEELAREYFHCVTTHSHLYRLENDLSAALLVEKGTGPHPAPERATPTNEQKIALWSSYVYKSLLSWVPYPDEV